MQTFSLYFLVVLSLVLSCEKDKKNGDDIKTPEPKVVEVGANSESIINVGVTQSPKGYIVNLADVPDNGNLECILNGVVLDECYNGMEFETLAAGEQTLRVRSLNSGQVLSIGEMRFHHEVVNGSGSGEVLPSLDSEHPLKIEIADDSLRNGSAYKISAELVIKLNKFAKAPCEKPILRCRYDRIDSPFWPLCSAELGHILSVGEQASGLQYLSLRAECGQTIGPQLDLYWYGVNETYQPLSIEFVALSSKRSSARLQKANDCPAEWLNFECRERATAQFRRCERSFDSDKIQSGLAMRAVCRSQVGPILSGN